MTGRRRTILVGALALVLGGALAAGWASGQPRPRRGAGFHVLELPAEPAPHKDRRILLQTPHLQVEAVSLPRGTHVDTHREPSALMMQALSGSGTVTVAGDDEPIDRKHAVYLAPNVAHVVTASEKEDLLMLVHKPAPGAGRLRRAPP